MPKYKYEAVDINNKKVKDIADAATDIDLVKQLRDNGLTPLTYTELPARVIGYKLKGNEISEYCRQMASMLSSGITVIRALDILKDRDFKPKLQQIYEQLHRDVQQGCTLSEAMILQETAFPLLLINMITSGEISGQLESVMSKMAVHYDKEHKLNGKIKTAMTYPAILLSVTVLVVLLIFTMILPEFFVLFGDMELPAVTQMNLNISSFLKEQWYIALIAAVALVALVRLALSFEKIAYQADYVKLQLPVIGKLLKIIYTARFARTLSSLYAVGISMLVALDISKTIIRNRYIEGQFPDVIQEVKNGNLLSSSIGAVDGFDKKLATSVLIGEESGRLDTMLEVTADAFDYEAEMATARLVQLIEPFMIVAMAVIIGFIMLSVMLPLISLYENAGNMF